MALKDWDDLKYVLALSRARTMRTAADVLGTNVATVSRRIDRITRQVGRQLFTRERDGWQATADAQLLIQMAEHLQSDMEAFERILERPDDELNGRISISCYQAIASVTLVPNLGQFRTRYPNLELEIEYGGSISLAHGDTDMAIRLSRPAEGRLVAKKIGWRLSGFYRRRGAPPDGGWIGLSRTYDSLPMMRQGMEYFQGEPRIRLSALSEIERAILTSDMAGPLLTCSARLRKELERINEAALSSVSPVYLVYHESRRNDPILQTVKQWAESCFAGHGNCCCGRCDPSELGVSKA